MRHAQFAVILLPGLVVSAAVLVPSTAPVFRVTVVTAAAEASAGAVNCDNWNTEEFFESATAEIVAACLAAGSEEPAVHDLAGRTPLYYAARYNDIPGVTAALLAAGADVNGHVGDGWTPLPLAAWHNANPAVVQMLLAAGADATAPGKFGSTPLYWAVRHGTAVLDLLIAAGADLAEAGPSALLRALPSNRAPG